jgi:hypothetical protein
MTIAMIFDAKGVTREQYEQVLRETSPNDKMPKGMLYHTAGPSEGGWNVVEVWETEAAAWQFFKEKLGKALERANVSVKPKLFRVHHTMK